MFSISDHLTDLMLKESIIQQEDKPIYIFGIKEILSQIYSGFGILIIGFTFGMVWQAVLFTATYMTLRVYAGGYHAPTQLRCYILSFMMVVAALLLIDWLLLPDYVTIISIAIVGGCIYILSPSEHVNKPLSEGERKTYKRKVGQRIGAWMGISLIFGLASMEQALICVLVAEVFLLVMMIGNTSLFSKKYKSA